MVRHRAHEGPNTAKGWVLDRADRVTPAERWTRTAYRGRAWVLCQIGIHWWADRNNPEVGGRRAHYQQCRRCGHERDKYMSWRDFDS